MAKKILLVDDEPLNRELLMGYLANQGYELLEASGAQEARLMLERYKPDLLLLDVIMPGEDGFSFCQWVKKEYRELFLPVILITALNDRESKLKGLECGADDFLSKPVDRIELSIKVRNMLKVRELQQNIHKELVLAQKVQQCLFFANNGLGPRDKMYYKPCHRIGGDLIEVWERKGMRWVFLADASGHGPSAALIAAAVKAFINKDCPDPAFFLEHLNQKLSMLLAGGDEGYYVTAVCFAIKEGRLAFAGAGHPPPMLRSQGEVKKLDSQGIPLGVLPQQEFSVQELAFQPGDYLLLYSDGLLDVLSEEQLEQAAQKAYESDDLYQYLLTCLQDANPSDDISFLII